jgi:hypothetical protein
MGSKDKYKDDEKDKKNDNGKWKNKNNKKDEKNIINVHVNCCDDKKNNHMKHDNCSCNHNEIERQVNNPADDVANPGMTQSETSLARFHDFILYGFNNLEGTGNTSGFAFSSDLGNTWTDGGTIPARAGEFNGGDPVIAVDRNGVFYYAQISTEMIAGRQEGVISVSTGTINPDRTITMGLPQRVGRGKNPAASDFGDQDKPWITVGPDADQPGNEALYVVWTDFNAPNSIRFSKFTTGATLTPLIPSQDIVVGNNNIIITGAFVVVDKQGTIYVFYEQRPNPDAVGTPNRNIFMTRSTDGGNTFSNSVPITTAFAAAGNSLTNCSGNNRPTIRVDAARQIRIREFPHAAIGPDGTIYVVWNAGRVVGASIFVDVFLAYSTNEGTSWNQVNVTNNLAYSFFPSVAANCLGAHVQYNRFNDPSGVGGVGNQTFGIFMKSFSPYTGLSEEQMVSTQFSPVPITIPNPDALDCYMSDYNQIIPGPGSCVLHSWGDNRNMLRGRNNPDVFFGLSSPKKNHNGCCD